MPTAIETPECLKTFLRPMFTDIDLDSVRFQDGLPFYAFLNPGAITVGSDIYFRAGKFDPCRSSGIALIAHELFHVRQGSAGFGIWFLRWFYLRYLWAWLTSGLKSGKEHPLEAPAYAFQARVADCCERVRAATGESSPCVCRDGQPTGVSQSFCEAFLQEFEGA